MYFIIVFILENYPKYPLIEKPSTGKRGKRMDLVIKVRKCTLVMTETELLNSLSPGLLEKAIRRGKGLKRCERVEQYEKSREDYRKEDVYGKVGDKG